MVNQLNEQAVGIVKVERARPVSMRLGVRGKRDTVTSQTSRPHIDVLRPADNETDVVHGLNGVWQSAFGQLVDREIILARREVNIVRIRHPLQLHSENIAIKLA